MYVLPFATTSHEYPRRYGSFLVREVIYLKPGTRVLIPHIRLAESGRFGYFLAKKKFSETLYDDTFRHKKSCIYRGHKKDERKTSLKP